MEIYRELFDSAKGEDWNDGIQWFGWSLFVGLVPVWMTILTLKLLGQPVKWSTFTDHGEFAVYSASYIGASLYLVQRSFSQKPFPSRGLITLILVTLLLLSTAMFSLVNLFSVLGDAESDELLRSKMMTLLNKDFVTVVSWVVLPFVCALSYVIVVTDNIIRGVNVAKIEEQRKADYDNLNSEFDKL